MTQPIPLNADALDGTIFISDNLPFLKTLDTESVDLVCIDPPFAKNATFTGRLRPPLNDDERQIEREMLEGWGVFDAESAYNVGIEYPDQTGRTAMFRDIFSFDRDVHEDWIDTIGVQNPGLATLIEATRYNHSDSTAAYIAFMAERMLEIHRILKPTGSVFIHCDDAANAYLIQMMDAIFGPDNYQNHISWRRTYAHNDARRCGRITDYILFYSKTENYTWNTQYARYSESYIRNYFRYEDERGRFRTVTLTGPGETGGESAIRWRGYSPTDSRRHWSVPRRIVEMLAGEEGNSLPITERLDIMDEEGYIYWPPAGSVPQYKEYLHEVEGVVLQDTWDDIRPLHSRARERAGYPTQKPQALAQRIILSASNPGDLVLDCFAGCAYVPVAAQLTGRRWIACDMSPRAWTIVRRQFHKHPDLGIVTEGRIAANGDGLEMEPQIHTLNQIIKVRGPHDLPTPTNIEPPVAQPTPRLARPKYRVRPHETDRQIWDAFVEQYGTTCWYCGAEKMNDRRELQLDHVEPNAYDGTNDDCWNRALACVACNSDKRNTRTPTETIQAALAAGRIPTPARMREIKETFAARRRWAQERWERIRPKPKPDADR